MSAEQTVDKLQKFFEAVKESEEGSKPAKFFPEAYGAATIADILKDFDFKEDDEKWEGLHAQKSPQAKYKEMRVPRLRIAFLSAGLREIRAIYASGKDDHPMTDVDVMRVAAHYTDNQVFRLDHIAGRLKD